MKLRTHSAIRYGLLVLAACCPSARSDDDIYVRHLRPLLKERCYACHGALKQEAGLRVDTGQLLRRGSDNGSVIDGELGSESVLIARLLADPDGGRMPPEGQALTEAEIEHFRKWIVHGATSPQGEVPEPDPADHWAFRVPERPSVPTGQDASWPRNPIDHFIQRRHSDHGLTPLPDASPEHLLRRVTLDLTGLPPTTVQLQAFLADPSPQHYGRIVESLLQSPQYGERWGRHWMDIWRYSDWYGRRDAKDVRNSAPQIWRWRDWIVDSLNADKSYARMIQEMLAADEIAPDDDSTWPATGFLIRNYYSLNPNEWMRHNVEYTTKAFLGLTFNCAHCHDHKYDPIFHDDYFRMRAFFEPIGIRQDRVVGEAEPPPFVPYTYGGIRKVERAGIVRIYDEAPDAPTWFYMGGDERNLQKDRGSILPGVPEFAGVPFGEITAVDLPMSGWYPGSRTNIQQAILTECETRKQVAAQRLDKALATNVDTRDLTAKLKQAEDLFTAALQRAVESGEQGALTGRQSVIIDAPNGRRILQRDLPGLSSLPDGSQISFQVALLKQSGHFNFQLARDAAQSLTALYVGFENGQISAYAPGGFSVIDVGRYPVDATAGHMDVRLILQPSTDSVLLQVEFVSGDQRISLVDGTPIALNGWNPAQHDSQPLTFDCRGGGRVLLDQVHMEAGTQSWHWDFEPNDFVDGEDVVGQAGWTAHPMSTGSASSLVSAVAGCISAQPASDDLRLARTALNAATNHLKTAELGVRAAELAAFSAEATIAADNAIRDQANAATIEQLSKAAYEAQLIDDEFDARWRMADLAGQLADAHSLPDSDKDTAKQISKLDSQLATARADLEAVLKRRTTTPTSVDYARLSPVTSKRSTGRRTALAEWITHPRNPLTPRVAINHIWMRHLHSPLVESVADFGRNGKRPTHPELLDWLSVELVEHNWSMKHIHRLIVTSRTYGMSSSGVTMMANREIDRENRFLWKMNAGRMEAEVVRDSVLFIAGLLDSTRGGQVLPNTQAAQTFRRSLYFEVFPENGGHMPLTEVFDAPDPGACFRRTSTIVPQQALALSNSETVHAAAAQTAKQIHSVTADNDSEFVVQCFRKVLSRSPTDGELTASVQFLIRQRGLSSADDAARESLVRVLFNHNDFLTIR